MSFEKDKKRKGKQVIKIGIRKADKEKCSNRMEKLMADDSVQSYAIQPGDL